MNEQKNYWGYRINTAKQEYFYKELLKGRLRQGWGYPYKFGYLKDLKKLLKETYSLGINFLDTAPAYGTSEERIGKLLKGWRKSWVLSTKAGEEFKGKSENPFIIFLQQLLKKVFYKV